MTMSSPEIERKVRELDNDVQSIYVMLADIQATQQRHSNRFQELTDMLGAHDARFDSHDARFDALEGKLDTVLELLKGRETSGD